MMGFFHVQQVENRNFKALDSNIFFGHYQSRISGDLTFLE